MQRVWKQMAASVQNYRIDDYFDKDLTIRRKNYCDNVRDGEIENQDKLCRCFRCQKHHNSDEGVSHTTNRERMMKTKETNDEAKVKHIITNHPRYYGRNNCYGGTVSDHQ